MFSAPLNRSFLAADEGDFPRTSDRRLFYAASINIACEVRGTSLLSPIVLLNLKPNPFHVYTVGILAIVS
jgi:hypothetical protein